MIVIQHDTINGCVSNILLQNIANEFNKTLTSHFISLGGGEFNLTLKEITKWYLDDKQNFMWIIDQHIEVDTYMTLGVLVNNYKNTKFVFVTKPKSKKEEHMLEELSKQGNFKFLNVEKDSVHTIYNFMKNKKYKTHNLKELLDRKDDYEIKNLYTEFGFFHFKECFLHGNITDGLLQKSENVSERVKSLIKSLYKKGVIQQSDKVVLAITEEDFMEDMIHFVSKKHILNMISSNIIKVYIKENKVQEFLKNIQITKIFTSEISEEYVDNNIGYIIIKSDIKYETAQNILMYLYNEMEEINL